MHQHAGQQGDPDSDDQDQHRNNPNQEQSQPTERGGVVTFLSLAYIAVQFCSALLGHYDKLTVSFGMIGGALFFAAIFILFMWRRKWITQVAALSLIWAVLATGALIYVGNRFVRALPITVSGTVISNDQGDPIFACVEIYDTNQHPVSQNRGSAEETGSFLVYNVPSGKYKLVVNGKWVSNFTVPEGYGKLFLTGFSGRINLEPEPVDVISADNPINPNEESVAFGNPNRQQAFQNSCAGTAVETP